MSKYTGLTPQLKEYLFWIDNYMEQAKMSPGVAEVANHFGQSTGYVSTTQLPELERLGFIKYEKGRVQKTLSLTKKAEEIVK